MSNSHDLRSITGHKLSGGHFLRFAYLDESGISTAQQDPYVIYAAVIVEPDRQSRILIKSIRKIADECFPEKRLYDLGKQYSFHAMDIWHGAKDFPRDKWPLKKRIQLLEKLIDVLVDNQLPVLVGYVSQESIREELEQWYHLSYSEQELKKQIKNHAITASYFRCARSIEAWMRENTNDEVVTLIVENNTDYGSMLTDFHLMISSPPDRDPVVSSPDLFVSNHIVEAPHLVEKNQSPLVQLADIAAFIIKRKLQKCEKVTPLFDRLRPTLFLKSVPGNGLSMDRNVSAMLVPDISDHNISDTHRNQVILEKQMRAPKENFKKQQVKRRKIAKKARRLAKANYGLPKG